VDITTNEVSTVGVGDEFSSNINVLEIGLDGRLYVGGQFNAIGESTTNHYAAAWDGNEWGPISLNQTAETFTGYVWKFAFSPNKVYVSGGFAGIKQLEISDDIWSDVGSLLGETRSLVVASNGDLYAAGMDYGTNQKYFARYDGTQWNQLKERGALDPTANTNSCDYNWCGSWKVDQSPTGQIWFGGEFEDVAGLSPVDNLAVWGNTAAASVRYMPVVAPRRDGATAVTPAELVKQSMMRRLYFAGNSYVLSPSTKASLKKIAAALTKGTTIQIVISGYVLTNKTTAWQRQLSKNRGIAVARYLRKLGVKASYEVEAMGKALESTVKARRVEVRISWMTTPTN
jgi:outer membrane protein OmpA-like peptidoglycan-associated protein